MSHFKKIWFVLVLVMLGSAGSVMAESENLESITVMALGPSDGRAVIALPDGKMQVLKVGERVPGTKAIVVQVLSDKLVVEESIEKSTGVPVRQMVWIYKSAKAGAKSRIQRIDPMAPEKELHPHPMPAVIINK